MQRKLMLKLAAIFVLSMLLLIPLSMIEAQIATRSARQVEVTRNIAESAAGAQTLVGPVVLIRYRERIERRQKEEATGREIVRQEIVERTRVLPPEKLDIGGDLRVESLNRGLYRARLFHLVSGITGRAVVPPGLGWESVRQVLDARAWLVVGIADPRGVANDPELRVNGKVLKFVTGTAGAMPGQGLHAALGEIDPTTGGAFEFALPLNLTGLERLAIAPAGETTSVALKSDWPHPSFQGRFLPQTRTVGDAGFEARWRVTNLARNFDRVLKSGEGGGQAETLGVALIDPVNVYLKSERAVKYGILFVVLTFAAFFLTEILRRLAIHPMQYLLVGLALAIFFLLLIALSEHMAFGLAYGVSAAACVALVGIYLAGALGSRKRGLAFGAGIATLYAVLYGVLLSEDNALLMGTLLLFLALGATMVATRRLDWYRISGLAGDEAV